MLFYSYLHIHIYVEHKQGEIISSEKVSKLVTCEGCDVQPPEVLNCDGEKTIRLLEFLFNGGDCSQSFITNDADAAEFACTDFNEGPTGERGDIYYIQTTNENGNRLYVDQWVTAGESFIHHQNPDREAISGGPKPTMFVYTDATLTNLVQQVRFNQYHQNDLQLMDKFGSAQLIEWATEDTVSVGFANQTFAFSVSVPISDIIFEGESITIDNFTIVSNQPPFFWDFSDEVGGQLLVSGGTLTVPPLEVPVDFVTPQT